MTYTENDLVEESDGEIKDKIKGEMSKVAQGQNRKIWEAFANVAEYTGQAPGEMLADMAIRAINNEDFAQTILNTEVTMEKLQTGDHRKEDIALVKEISEEFDLEPSSSGSIVDKIIEQRIANVGSGPFDDLTDKADAASKKRQIKKLEQEIQELKMELKRQTENQARESTQPREGESEPDRVEQVSEDKKDLDDIFGSDDDSAEEEETAEEVEVVEASTDSPSEESILSNVDVTPGEEVDEGETSPDEEYGIEDESGDAEQPDEVVEGLDSDDVKEGDEE